MTLPSICAPILIACLPLSPTGDVTEAVARGETLLARGDDVGARSAFLAALEVDPTSVRALAGCAEAMRRLGDLDAALEVLSRAGDLDRAPRLLVTAAAVLEDLERFERARDHLERAIAQQPDSNEARLALGVLLLRRGRNEEASASFRRCLEIDARSVAARHNLALARARLGALEEAVDEYHRAAALEPGNARVLYGLGSALEKLDRLPEARDALARAIEGDPEFAAAHYRLANVLVRLGRRDEGLSAMRRFRSLKARDHFARAETARERGDVRRAIREYQRSLDAHPALVDAHARLGLLYLRSRDADAALRHVRTAARLEPRGFRFANVAWVCLKSGRPDEARRWVARALEAEPGRAEWEALHREIESTRPPGKPE